MVVISYRERNCKFLSGEAFTYKSKLYRGGRCCVMRFVSLTLLTGKTFSRANRGLFKKNTTISLVELEKSNELFLSREHRTDVTASYTTDASLQYRKKTCTRGNVALTLFRTYSNQTENTISVCAIEWTRRVTIEDTRLATTTRLRLPVITAKTDRYDDV